LDFIFGKGKTSLEAWFRIYNLVMVGRSLLAMLALSNVKWKEETHWHFFKP
jgi:hypothetical protein